MKQKQDLGCVGLLLTGGLVTLLVPLVLFVGMSLGFLSTGAIAYAAYETYKVLGADSLFYVEFLPLLGLWLAVAMFFGDVLSGIKQDVFTILSYQDKETSTKTISRGIVVPMMQIISALIWIHIFLPHIYPTLIKLFV